MKGSIRKSGTSPISTSCPKRRNQNTENHFPCVNQPSSFDPQHFLSPFLKSRLHITTSRYLYTIERLFNIFFLLHDRIRRVSIVSILNSKARFYSPQNLGDSIHPFVSLKQGRTFDCFASTSTTSTIIWGSRREGIREQSFDYEIFIIPELSSRLLYGVFFQFDRQLAICTLSRSGYRPYDNAIKLIHQSTYQSVFQFIQPSIYSHPHSYSLPIPYQYQHRFYDT